MLVVGTGAVASFLLPRFRAAGISVQVFGPPSMRLAALQPYGVNSEPQSLAQHDEWLIVCKTWQNVAKVEELLEAPRPQRILILQNGLEPEKDWLALGVEVQRGLSTYGVTTLAPGHSVGGEQGEIALARGSAWISTLRQAGLSVREQRDMRAAVWWKLVVNASLNVVAAVSDLTNGQVLENASARRWAALAAEEVAALASSLGVDLGTADPVWAMERIARATAGNVCSTLADLRSGRPTEYDSINGALLRLGQARGQRLPVLDELDCEFALVSVRQRVSQGVAS